MNKYFTAEQEKTIASIFEAYAPEEFAEISDTILGLMEHKRLDFYTAMQAVQVHLYVQEAHGLDLNFKETMALLATLHSHVSCHPELKSLEEKHSEGSLLVEAIDNLIEQDA